MRILGRVGYAALLVLVSLCTMTRPVLAIQSPVGCTGSGLGINLFSSHTQIHVGETIKYSVQIFNGPGGGSIVCDATNIVASLVTPDGVTHPITLTRTSLSDGQSDYYGDVVSYVARSQDVNPSNGTLAATASDTGVIHQNVVDSEGGAYQGLNVFVLNTLHVIKVVVNNYGGTAIASDFNLHVIKSSGGDVAGSPAVGTDAPGTSYSIIAGDYTVSEDENASYAQSFSGDCDSSGKVSLLAGDDKTCTVTNNEILRPTATPMPTERPTATPTTPMPTKRPTATETPTPTTSGGSSTDSGSSGSSTTETVCPTLAPGIVPPMITDSRRVNATAIFISWGPDSGTDKFIVEYGPKNGDWLYNTNVTGFSTTIESLPSNQPFWFRVAARNDCQIGSFGEPKLVGGGVGGTNWIGFPDTGGSPLLPNTGLSPTNQSSLGKIIASFSLSLIAFYLTLRLYRLGSK